MGAGVSHSELPPKPTTSVRIYEADRDLALKQDVTNAVERLYKLQGPSLPFPKNHPATKFMEHERLRAVRDVIAYLRLKTGQDLGEEPEPWILAYGDENLKMNQGAREEDVRNGRKRSGKGIMAR